MGKIGKPQTSKGLATFCAKIAEEKIAIDTIIMNLTQVEGAPSDFFVICTCGSDVQMRAVVDAIEKACVSVGIKRPKVEGFTNTQWILLDFFDVVMHIMLKNARNFYKIEKLWSDASFSILSDKGTPKAIKLDEFLNSSEVY